MGCLSETQMFGWINIQKVCETQIDSFLKGAQKARLKADSFESKTLSTFEKPAFFGFTQMFGCVNMFRCIHIQIGCDCIQIQIQKLCLTQMKTRVRPASM
jgi:hypothetical protein